MRPRNSLAGKLLSDYTVIIKIARPWWQQRTKLHRPPGKFNPGYNCKNSMRKSVPRSLVSPTLVGLLRGTTNLHFKVLLRVPGHFGSSDGSQLPRTASYLLNLYPSNYIPFRVYASSQEGLEFFGSAAHVDCIQSITYQSQSFVAITIIS